MDLDLLVVYFKELKKHLICYARIWCCTRRPIHGVLEVFLTKLRLPICACYVNIYMEIPINNIIPFQLGYKISPSCWLSYSISLSTISFFDLLVFDLLDVTHLFMCWVSERSSNLISALEVILHSFLVAKKTQM